MENNPTKLENILQAMQPEDRERSIELLQLIKKKKIEAFNKKNLEAITKRREEQLKTPLDLEYEIARIKLNSMDHADHSEYLRQIKELEIRHGKERTDK